MTEFVPSARESLLLSAALNPDAKLAAESWQEWSHQIDLESAPVAELRLLTPVYEHISAVMPTLALPRKLRGKARATFTRNQVVTSSSLPAVAHINSQVPVVIAKGLAFCARFGAWSSRQMGDADIYVPFRRLEAAGDILAELGWVPKYGMTWESLKHRSSLRRNSWNLTKGHGDIDLHWRVLEGPEEAWLEHAMWGTASGLELRGQRYLFPSAEFATIMSLNHGFVEGTRGDSLQAIVDCSKWLPLCDSEKLGSLLSRVQGWAAYGRATEILASVGLKQTALAKPATKVASSRRIGAKPDAAVLKFPWLYRLWEVMGRAPILERLLLRLTGPFSKPLAARAIARGDYDLRDCSTIDELAGPGWGWPEPEHTCFWTDRADCRLLVPLASVCDHVIVLTVSQHRVGSPNQRVRVFANGRASRRISLGDVRLESDYAFIIPRQVLHGPWVELSFRPQNYLGDAVYAVEQYASRRSIPASRLRVLNADDVTETYSSALSILRGDRPHAARLDRIRAKIAASPYKDDPRLPRGFDPAIYALSNQDLIEAEVDPLKHFLLNGYRENRPWRHVVAPAQKYASRLNGATGGPDVFNADDVSELSSSALSILRGDQADAPRLDRIRAKIAASPFKDDPRLPPDFDPAIYALSNQDLIEAEVDPYEHFVFNGHRENRSWR